MKRRRSSAPGRLRPDGRWSRPTLLAILLVALAACGAATVTDEPSPSEVPAQTAAAPTIAPVTEAPNGEPTATTGTPSAGSTESPQAATPDPSSADPGSAQACTGNEDNRDLFAAMAAAVDWAVYCPVLPEKWFVVNGHYRLVGGGWMEITYTGPGNAGIALRQGAFCSEPGDCVPAGHEVGSAAFGDRSGTLIAGDDGSWAVIVDRGSAPAWLLQATGMDEAGVRSIAEHLQLVGG